MNVQRDPRLRKRRRGRANNYQRQNQTTRMNPLYTPTSELGTPMNSTIDWFGNFPQNRPQTSAPNDVLYDPSSEIRRIPSTTEWFGNSPIAHSVPRYEEYLQFANPRQLNGPFRSPPTLPLEMPQITFNESVVFANRVTFNQEVRFCAPVYFNSAPVVLNDDNRETVAPRNEVTDGSRPRWTVHTTGPEANLSGF